MKHNMYADGNFQNIEFIDAQGDKSIGVVAAGTYTFTTEREETVTCISGTISINGNRINSGESIVTGPGETFTISAEETSSYICSYAE